MTKGEHTNERTYVLTYIRTGQTLYPLHNFVLRGDNKSSASVCIASSWPGLVFQPLKRQSRQQQTTFINAFSLFYKENKT